MPALDGGDHVADTYEVVEGKHYHRDSSGNKKLLRAGDQFHPTRKQVAGNDLAGKARKVAESSGPTSVSGADIGLRSLEWGSEAALKLALDEGLDEGAFVDIEPSGATGYVKSDVEAVMEG